MKRTIIALGVILSIVLGASGVQAQAATTYWTKGYVSALSNYDNDTHSWQFGFTSDCQWGYLPSPKNIVQSQADIYKFLGVDSGKWYTASGDTACYNIFQQSMQMQDQGQLTFYFTAEGDTPTFTSVKECAGVSLRPR